MSPTNKAETLTHAYVAEIVSKPEHATEVADLLTGALELANAEPGTPVWFSVRANETLFYVFDAFDSQENRQTHADGAIVAALGANSGLLAQAPNIVACDILATKLESNND